MILLVILDHFVLVNHVCKLYTQESSLISNGVFVEIKQL